MIEGETGKPFEVHETGWGEFEITLKLYYATESGEKPQTLYHHLRLHPYGRNDEEKEAMRMADGEVKSWSYDEQLFNDPYETFYNLLTTGAHPKGMAPTGGKGKGKGKSAPPLDPKSGDVWERSAMIPLNPTPSNPFSRATEDLELKKLDAAIQKAQAMTKKVAEEIKSKEAELRRLKEENAAATGTNKG